MYALKKESKIIPLKPPEVTIGRHTQNKIVVQASLNVSRRHAVIVFIDNKPFIKDISGAEWGTYIKDFRIPPEREVLLKEGDFIGIGSKANDDKNCTFELVTIEHEEILKASSSQSPDIPATQVPNETIDITNAIDHEIIDISDEEDKIFNVSDSRHKNERLSPSILINEPTQPIVATKNLVDLVSVDVDKISITAEQKPAPVNTLISTLVLPSETVKPSTSQPRMRKPKHISIVDLEEDSDRLNDSVEKKLSALLGDDNIQTSTPTSGNEIPIKVECTQNSAHNEDRVVHEEFAFPTNSGIINASDENTKVKPEMVNQTNEFRVPYPVLNLSYSTSDEVILLDSDEEDFPSSQLNTTQISNVPDYTSSFKMMYDIKPEINYEEENENKSYNNDSWFEPLSQTNLVESSKEFRKKEKFLDDDVDSTTDELIHGKENEVVSVLAQQSSSKVTSQKLEKSPKIPIIDAIPLKRRRMHSKRDSSNKRKSRERSESPDTICKKMMTAEQRQKRLSPFISKHRNRNLPLTSSQMERNKNERKQKLKEICVKREAGDMKNSTKNKGKDIIPKVKVTNSNRGAFLTDLPTPTGVRPSKKEKQNKSTDSIKSENSETTNSSLTTSKNSTEGIEKLKVSTVLKKNDETLVPKLELSISDHLPCIDPQVELAIDEQIAKKNDNLTMPLTLTKDTGNDVQNKVSPQKISSILKKKKFKYGISTKKSEFQKKVFFKDECNAIFEFISNPELEYFNNFASIQKFHEALFKEEQLEFEFALSKVCSWSVRWLEEQQKQVALPPVYPPVLSSSNYISSLVKYKELLRFEMFSSLWKLIFNAWNSPDNDNLPLTQLVVDNNYLSIEKVEEPKSDKYSRTLWTIYAKRDASLLDSSSCITSGMLVILNFRVKKPANDLKTKTMVFAYISSVNRFKEGNRPVEGIVLKIHPKPFQIELGQAKMKVLTYMKTQLRQFQGLAMLPRAPLANALSDENYCHKINAPTDLNQPLLDVHKFLDHSQRKAIVTIENRILCNQTSVSIIDGAAGTGKSQVIVSLLHELWTTKRDSLPSGFKVLVITNCDKDSDDLVYRLDNVNKKGKVMNLLRFGNGVNMHTNVKECSMEKRVEDYLNDSTLIDVLEEQNNLRAKINSAELVLQATSASKSKREEAEAKLQTYKADLTDMTSAGSEIISNLKRQLAREKTIANAEVIVTALYSCWSSYFEQNFVPTCHNKGDVQQFNVCIFDDANLCIENAMLIPQMLLVPHLVLVGDDKCRAYVGNPYHRLLANFSTNNRDSIFKLDIQHRMHSDLLEWVLSYFKPEIKQSVAGKRRSCLKSYMVIDHNRGFEPYEEQIILCEKLMIAITTLETNENTRIGVIVATNQQKEAIRNTFGQTLSRKIIVDLLEDYNGREQDVVVLCLPEPYRMDDFWLYIAVTRAKSTLIICGNFEEIKGVPSITSLVENAKNRNVFIQLKNGIQTYTQEHIDKVLKE